MRLKDETYEYIKQVVIDNFIYYKIRGIPINPFEIAERSNTPGTSYVIYRKDGTFDQLRVFGADRIPQFDIDYGMHQGEKYLHVHYYEDGVRSSKPVELYPSDIPYRKYKSLFKEVIK